MRTLRAFVDRLAEADRLARAEECERQSGCVPYPWLTPAERADAFRRLRERQAQGVQVTAEQAQGGQANERQVTERQVNAGQTAHENDARERAKEGNTWH